MLHVTESFLPMRMVEFVWLYHMPYKLCPREVFLSKKVFVEEVMLTVVEKTLVHMCNLH